MSFNIIKKISIKNLAVKKLVAIFFLLVYQANVYALTHTAAQVTTTSTPSPSLGLLKMFVGLFVVVGIMLLLAWFVKRLGLVNHSQTSVAKVISSVSVGSRERVVVLEIANRWVVVGVAPGRVNAITTLDNVPVSANQITPSDAGSANAALNSAVLNPIANSAWMLAVQKFLKPNQPESNQPGPNQPGPNQQATSAETYKSNATKSEDR